MSVVRKLKEVEVDRIFGETVASRPAVESQKRGLQHAHILIFLKKKITTEVVDTQDVVDDFVCAEVPTDNPQLQKIVLDQMIHGPCGAVDPNACCMRPPGAVGKTSRKRSRRRPNGTRMPRTALDVPPTRS